MKRLLVFLIVLFISGPAFGAVVSSRTMPTSPVISTFGGATRDYNGASGVADWELATRITSVDVSAQVLECYADEAVYEISTTVTFQLSSAATGSKFRVIKAADGHENRFRKTGGVIFKLTGAATYMFQIYEKGFAIYDIGFTSAVFSDGTYRRLVYTYTNSDSSRFVGLYFFDATNTGGVATTSGLYLRSGTGQVVINCVFDSCDLGTVGQDTTKTFLNCTAVDCEIGFHAVNVAQTAKNCIAENNTTNWAIYGIGSWTKTNFTDDSGVVFEADGFTPASTDTVAINQGADLEGVHGFNDDGMGIERGDGTYTGAAWDIGALEYYVAPGGGMTRKLLLNLF